MRSGLRAAIHATTALPFGPATNSILTGSHASSAACTAFGSGRVGGVGVNMLERYRIRSGRQEPSRRFAPIFDGPALLPRDARQPRVRIHDDGSTDREHHRQIAGGVGVEG